MNNVNTIPGVPVVYKTSDFNFTAYLLCLDTPKFCLVRFESMAPRTKNSKARWLYLLALEDGGNAKEVADELRKAYFDHACLVDPLAFNTMRSELRTRMLDHERLNTDAV